MTSACCEVAIRLPVVVGHAEVDGLDAVVVLLALAHVRETPDAVARLHAQLDFQRTHEGAEHVQQHALASFLDDAKDFHVHQGREDDRLAAFELGRVVDLPHHLVRLVHAVDEGQAHVARLQLELRQDGIAEGLGRDAGAVGDEEYGSGVHGLPVVLPDSAGAPKSAGPAYNGGNYPIPHRMRRPGPYQQAQSPRPRMQRRSARAQTRFQLLEFSHVCTFWLTRPGESSRQPAGCPV